MINRQEIEKIIPHRYPYLMIDSADIKVPGSEGSGYKELRGSEYFFEGHFPARPVMPGVLTVETIAQTAMVVIGRGDLRLSGVERIKFRQTIEPGDRLEIKVKLISSEEGVFRFSGEVILGENTAASGEVLLEGRAID